MSHYKRLDLGLEFVMSGGVVLEPADGRGGEVHLVLAPVGLRHRGLKTRGEVLLTLREEVTRMLSEPQ